MPRLNDFGVDYEKLFSDYSIIDYVKISQDLSPGVLPHDERPDSVAPRLRQAIAQVESRSRAAVLDAGCRPLMELLRGRLRYLISA